MSYTTNALPMPSRLRRITTVLGEGAINAIGGAIILAIGALLIKFFTGGTLITMLGGIAAKDFEKYETAGLTVEIDQPHAAKFPAPGNPWNNNKPGCPEHFVALDVTRFVFATENGAPIGATLRICTRVPTLPGAGA